MPDSTKVTAQGIQDMLTALTDALGSSQAHLSSMAAFDAAGRELPRYHIPHLDFTFDIEASQSSQPGVGFMMGPRQSSSVETSAKISGRIVSIPPNAGLPKIEILVELAPQKVIVTLINDAGEMMTNTQISVEIDSELTVQAGGTQPTSNQKASVFIAQQYLTDVGGIAEIDIVTAQLHATKPMVLRISSGNTESYIAVTKGALA
jgi:hypothetical protein